MQSQELDFTILMGPFQLRIFYAMTLFLIPLPLLPKLADSTLLLSCRSSYKSASGKNYMGPWNTLLCRHKKFLGVPLPGTGSMRSTV